MSLSGIDVSNYQANNYKSLISSYGKDFVIIRATYGFNVDPICDTIYQYVKNQGKLLGVYFFPHSAESSGAKYAEWCYQQVLGYVGTAVFALDWEAFNGQNTDPAWALDFLNRFFELSGVRPMIYMNSSYEKSYNWTNVVNGNYGLWVANYGSNNGSDAGRPATKYWKSAAMHQFTSNPCDRNTFYGDKTAWQAYAKVQKPDSSKPTTPSTPSDKIYTEAECQAKIDAAVKQYKESYEEVQKLYNTLNADVKELIKSFDQVTKFWEEYK